MKKSIYKIIFIFSLLLLSMLFCSYSKNNNKTIKGYIHVYGNEPFTYIGIKTKENKEYSIAAEEKIYKELKSTQGKEVELSGIIILPEKDGLEPGMLKDGKIEVIEWKYVK